MRSPAVQKWSWNWLNFFSGCSSHQNVAAMFCGDQTPNTADYTIQHHERWSDTDANAANYTTQCHIVGPVVLITWDHSLHNPGSRQHLWNLMWTSDLNICEVEWYIKSPSDVVLFINTDVSALIQSKYLIVNNCSIIHLYHWSVRNNLAFWHILRQHSNHNV